MSQGTNSERITQNNAQIDTIKNIASNLPIKPTYNTSEIWHVSEDGRTSTRLDVVLNNIGATFESIYNMIETKIQPYTPGTLYRTNYGSSNMFDPRTNGWWWRNSGYNFVTFERIDGIRLLAYIKKDFTASSTEATATANFEKDVQLGNIIPIRIPESEGEVVIYDWDRNYPNITVNLPVGSTFNPALTFGFVKGDIAQYIEAGQSTTTITPDDTSYGTWCVCGAMGWYVEDDDETQVALWIASDYTYNEEGTHHFAVTFSNDRISESLNVDLTLNIVASLPNWDSSETSVSDTAQYGEIIQNQMLIGQIQGEYIPNYWTIDVVSSNYSNLSNFNLGGRCKFVYDQANDITNVYLTNKSTRGIVSGDQLNSLQETLRINVYNYNPITLDVTIDLL